MKRIAPTILAILIAAPALAQPWEGYYQPTSSPRPDFAVLALDPEGEHGPDRYHFVSLADLMAPVYTFPDNLTRYIAVKRSTGRPTFTAAELAAGATSPGLLTAAPVPRIPQGSGGVWVGVAVPAARPLTYTAFGSAESRTDRTGTFVPQAGAVTLDGAEHSVWVGNETIAFGLDRRHVFFAPGASVPVEGGAR